MTEIGMWCNSLDFKIHNAIALWITKGFAITSNSTVKEVNSYVMKQYHLPPNYVC